MFCSCSDTCAAGIYTLSLHDALPISPGGGDGRVVVTVNAAIDAAATVHGSDHDFVIWGTRRAPWRDLIKITKRSEEHTSELQSRPHLVCRLLLEKKKQI